MPNDIYQWDRGLVHHCPFCFTPLTRPESRTRCLGEHVEWCKNYHNQLFKKGTSSQCLPCQRSDEEDFKRHREIAVKILELRSVKSDPGPASPLTPRSINTYSSPDAEAPLTRKERKAAKKATKANGVKKVVSSADIDLVKKVLHPEHEIDDIEVERQLIDDLDIHLNRFFHKGTSNTTEMRRAFVNDRESDKEKETHVDATEIDGLLQLLDVAPITSTSTAEDRSIFTDLRKLIEADLLQERREHRLMMMRKGGFWRWASKKAYKRLVQNGKIWSDKEVDNQLSQTDDTTSSSDAVGGAEIEDIEPLSQTTAQSNENLPSATPSANAKFPKKPSATPRTIKIDSDGWTTVGSSVKRRSPKGSFKLVHNTGLTKIGNTPRLSGEPYSSVLGRDEDV